MALASTNATAAHLAEVGCLIVRSLDWLVLGGAALALYIIPLISPNASIQWDAVDAHYSLQRYLAEHLHAGVLPFWTPYIFAGFPFLADPLVGAWYPLNWPFFVAGITPKSIEAELFLHALIACTGAYTLARRFVDAPLAAVLAGCLYGFSGYFAGRSAHVAMFQSAALFPWLLLAFLRLLEHPSAVRVAVAGGLEALVLLAGHFQTALYASVAVVIFAAAEVVRRRGRPLQAIGATSAVFGLGVACGAIQILPGLELAQQSIRTTMDPSLVEGGIIPPDALLTLVNPDQYRIFEGDYTGPSDVTQYYFYAGRVLLPLAVVGLWRVPPVRSFAALLSLPWAWYTLTPTFGGVPLLAHLPGFSAVRNPVNAWFLIALALALLAGAGLAVVRRLPGVGRLGVVIVAISLVDLCFFNMLANPLAYAHLPFAAAYGDAEDRLRAAIADRPPLGRVHGGRPSLTAGPLVSGFGSLNHPLDVRLQATYGYDPLELRRYDAYFRASLSRPDLVAGMSVSDTVQHSELQAFSPHLAMAYFPSQVIRVADEAESLRHLDEIQPPLTALAEGGISDPVAPSEADVAEVVSQAEERLVVRYRASSDRLLRLAIPWFPGWQARVDGQSRPLVAADHAFTGVVVPQGEHELTLEYSSTYFVPSALCSLAAVLVIGGCLLFGRRLRISSSGSRA